MKIIFKDTTMEFECEHCDYSTDSKSGLNSHVGHEHPGKSLWDDPEELERLYWEEGLSQKDVGERLGCSSGTISNKLEEFEVERRNGGHPKIAPSTPAYYQLNDGYELWEDIKGEDGSAKQVSVHQLLACVDHDPHEVFDEDTVVHHGRDGHDSLPPIEHPRANFEGNLEVMSRSDHANYHDVLDIREGQPQQKSAMDW